MQTTKRNVKSAPLRVAWMGEVQSGGGVGGIGTTLLEGLLRQGIQVDYYHSFEALPEKLQGFSNLRTVYTSPQWLPGQWYSSSPFSSFLSGTFARARAYNRLVDALLENHARTPYDCIFQLSQTELFKLGKNLHRLPPMIVYPCVHAAGELYWHQKESAYALKSEKWWMHYLVRTFFTYRAWLQKREVQKPAIVMGMSQRFNDLIGADYGISADRQAVLHHPIRQLNEVAIQIADQAAEQRSVTKILFIARMSVRKGLQYVTELSHRLDDLAGQVQIDVIGDRTQWSDYRAHLQDLNPRTARYLGGMKHQQVAAALSNADILVLPSLYEPGGIVIGEALSYGICVVASDAIGSAEVLSGECHREFPAGDSDAFEREVRQLIQDLQANRQQLRECARQQCQQHFSPDTIASKLIQILEQAAGKQHAENLEGSVLSSEEVAV